MQVMRVGGAGRRAGAGSVSVVARVAEVHAGLWWDAGAALSVDFVWAGGGGCQSVFQKYSTLLVFTSVTHTSPASQPAS